MDKRNITRTTTETETHKITEKNVRFKGDLFFKRRLLHSQIFFPFFATQF